jgi:hypothetical protein
MESSIFFVLILAKENFSITICQMEKALDTYSKYVFIPTSGVTIILFKEWGLRDKHVERLA